MENEQSKTFVLVHGSWHGPWCWAKVGQHLTARGHEVICPRLPSDTADAGQDEYLAAIEDALRNRSDVVLVAHSMSGLVAPLATGNHAVSSLVLLAALVRRPGTAWASEGLEPFAQPMRKVLSQATFDDSARIVLDPAEAAELFYHDCLPADAADATSRLRPDASLLYQQTCPELPARKVPTTYVSCRDDRTVDGAWNAAVAKELLGATVLEIDGGHSPFLSAPERLAELLVEL